MTTATELVAWRDGRYIYCLTHSDSQVFDSQPVYKGDDALWDGKRCDWCKAKLETATPQ